MTDYFSSTKSPFGPAGKDGIYGAGEADAYWSNLGAEENDELIRLLRSVTPREAINNLHPNLEEVIYSPKRIAGLELLDLSGNETCIDYGCMWGALTVPLAKRTQFVIGVDKTRQSLQFLKARAKESGCENIALVQSELREFPLLNEPVDIAIVNGVLEWIAESGTVELKSFFKRRLKRSYAQNPGVAQEKFLRRVAENLKPGGKLYLAIENRYAYSMFLGGFDPHNGMRFTTICPRFLASLLSLIQLGRPYVNWLYSPRGLKNLLIRSGFKHIDLYACFPDYRFPEKIIPFSHSMSRFASIQTDVPSTPWGRFRRRMKVYLELLLFRYFQLRTLAPSIIAVART